MHQKKTEPNQQNWRREIGPQNCKKAIGFILNGKLPEPANGNVENKNEPKPEAMKKSKRENKWQWQLYWTNKANEREFAFGH